MPVPSKYKAVIQKNQNTGVDRLFFKAERKVWERSVVDRRPRLTGYTNLAMVMTQLSSPIPVYHDERINVNGVACSPEYEQKLLDPNF